MFGTKVGMETETGFQLVNRLGSNPRGENLVEALERVMIALEAGHALLDRKPWLHRFRH